MIQQGRSHTNYYCKCNGNITVRGEVKIWDDAKTSSTQQYLQCDNKKCGKLFNK